MRRVILRRVACGVSLISLLLGTLLVVASPANASPDERQVSTALGDDYVLVESFDENGDLIRTQKFDRTTRGETVKAPEGGITPYDSGSGGTSTPSGCQRVTVSNEVVSSVFGSTLFWFYTWTEWCWDRADYLVNDVSTGYSYDIEDEVWDFVSEHVIEEGHYSYVSGYPSSGYQHEREAKFTGACLAWFCDNSWPENFLYSHHDGTWSWITDED